TNNTFDEFLSDPNKPVPYTAKQLDARSFYNREYMIEDQRFTAARPDVLIYQTNVLEDSLTIVGPIEAELYVSTTGTDADWIVKVIDVFPDSVVNPKPNPQQFEMGGFQQLIRGEIMRGKFRNSYEHPEPFKPGEITKVKITLQDVAHTFLKGHKIMVQIQSSWFPFFDRNPQKFCDIYDANESDFQKATHRVYHSAKYPSAIQINLLREKK
ncbi:MAG: CocE/NonD family hydrolase, partial [Ignavibacteriaceae bacterium]